MFGWFKKKEVEAPPPKMKSKKSEQINSFPTITPNARHRMEDKLRHKFFLEELKTVLTESNLFKPSYIKRYMSAYRPHKEFVSQDINLIYKLDFFERSLLKHDESDARQGKYAKQAVKLSLSRAEHRLNVFRLKQLGIYRVHLSFDRDENICSDTIEAKRKLEGVKMHIDDVPILPFKTCFKCINKVCFISPFMK